MMIGGKRFIAVDRGLMFSIGRNANGINRIIVRLDADDTYTVESWRIHGTSVKMKSSDSGRNTATPRRSTNAAVTIGADRCSQENRVAGMQ